MQVSKLAALAAVSLLGVGGQASAIEAASAQAAAVKGSVVVERGGRLIPLTANTALSAGDRVISMDSGEAQIKFADGCSVPLHSNTVATVGAQSPCAASGLSRTATPMDFGGEAGTVVLGFLAVGLVAWGVYEATSSDKQTLRPISP